MAFRSTIEKIEETEAKRINIPKRGSKRQHLMQEAAMIRAQRDQEQRLQELQSK